MQGEAVIVGAGIGGLAAANALQRKGWSVRIFERAADSAPGGSGVAIAPNAVQALRYLGFSAALEKYGHPLSGLEARLRSGRRVMRIGAEELRAKYGAGFYGVHRADLRAMLLETLDAAPRHRHRVVGVSDDGPTVTVQGPDGPFAFHADLVVVADGVNSRFRAELFPGHPGPAYAGYVAWRGIVPAESGARVDAVLRETWGEGLRVGVHPLRNGQTYWYGLQSARRGHRPSDGVAALASNTAGWPSPVGELIAATPPSAVLCHEVGYLAEPLSGYVRGATALLGDAAHAVTPDVGQGACLAIEDAVVLAEEVAARGVADGLKGYDTARRPRTQRIARASGRMARSLQGAHPVAARVRDVAATVTPLGVNGRFSDNLYDWTPPRTGR